MSPVTLHAAALILYLAAAVLYGANVALRGTPHLLRARVLLVLAVALHTAGIGAFCVVRRESPFVSSFGTLSIAAWVVALATVPVEFLGKVSVLGALATPVACVLLFAGFLKSGGYGAAPEIKSQVVSLHVLMVLISFALFALAACCAVFYVWQYSALKHPDKRAMFRRLPPLATVDSLAYHLVAFALPLLTLGLALGILRAMGDASKPGWLLDPHTLVSFFAWMVYCAYLVARIAAGWRGARLNYLLIAGMAVTIALFFVPSPIHRADRAPARAAQLTGEVQ